MRLALTSFFLNLDLTIPEIFYFKYDTRASMILMFIGNIDVDNIGDTTQIQSHSNIANYAAALSRFTAH